MTSYSLNQRGGSGIKIAIIDSGIDLSHPLLHGVELLHDWAYTGTTSRRGDVCGHGTEVAAIVKQLAPGSTLGSFRVLDAGLRTTTEAIVAAARHAMSLGYHILNLSLADSAPGCAVAHEAWVREAAALGVHVVAASSNKDVDLAQYPAFLPGVISVCSIGAAPGPEIFQHEGAIQFAASGSMAELKDIAKILPAGVMYIEPEDDPEIPDVDGEWEADDVSCASYAVPRVTAALANILADAGPLTALQAVERLRLITTIPRETASPAT